MRPLLAARGFAVPDRPGIRFRTLADVFAYAEAQGVTLRIDSTEVQVRRPAAKRPGRKAFVSGKKAISVEQSPDPDLGRLLIPDIGQVMDQGGLDGTIHAMHSWASLTIAEQTLMRRAISGYSLDGMVQNYGVALRWAGADGAPPPRSYTEDEQRALVPKLAAVALDLAGQDLLTVHERVGPIGKAADTALIGSDLHEVLTDPANWIWAPDAARRFVLGAPQPVREHWFDGAHPTADTSGLPTWDELSLAQRKVLVCASELSGMLTGPFGIWEDPPADLDAAGRLAWIDRQLEPLLPFVRDGWIEVQHYPAERGDAYTVIPVEGLRSALNDPSIRYDGNDWGVGIGCIFTYAGLATWRGGWSKAWSKRLILD